MKKNCRQCEMEFEILPEQQRYFDEHGVCLPVYCRLCSFARKLSWDNEYRVYKRKCDLSGENMISVFNENAPFPVYKKEYWLKDNWDLPKIKYDKNKSFFEQYWNLFSLAPRPNVNCVNAENSEFAHLVFDSKSVYLSFQVFLCERVIGCYRVIRLRDSVNCFFCMDSELLMECSNCAKCYNLKFCEDCEGSSDSAFLYDCRGCRDCFMSYNLRNKSFCFKNEQLTKDEYEKKIKEYDLGTLEGLLKAKKDFAALRDNFIVKNIHQINCEKCEGDYLIGCKNCREIYFSDGCEDSSNVLRGTEDIDSFDAVVGGKIELCLNVLQPGYSYKCAFMTDSNHCTDVYLSENCDHCENCLGCISLKRGKYCILNEKYSEEEYEDLKKHIFKELNEAENFEEFFDPQKSPFKYEETIANLYFPKNSDEPLTENGGEEVCKTCGKPFKAAEAEEKFYQKSGVALPDNCFYCRILNLARKYSSVIMKKQNCYSCGKEIVMPESARNFGKIYCEECYMKAIY